MKLGAKPDLNDYELPDPVPSKYKDKITKIRDDITDKDRVAGVSLLMFL